MHPHSIGILEYRPASYQLNTPLVTQTDQSVGQFIDHLTLVIANGIQINLRRPKGDSHGSGMGGIMNGMALHGGLRPFGGTFLIFSDYMRPAVRLAALMGLPTTYVYTHDSIGLGEDGPTHQPIEQLMSLRLIPGLMDLRPADPAETSVAWRTALARTDGPAFLSLTRQNVPNLHRTESRGSAEGVARGAYILAEASGGEPRAVLLASGSEVQIAVEARDALEAEGVPTRVVSFPSWHLFGEQSADYQRQVLGGDSAIRVAVEAGSRLGWERWTGRRDAAIGLDRFGASAPAEVLYQKLGITAEAVAGAVRQGLADGA